MSLTVPAQVIEGYIYVPVRDLQIAGIELYDHSMDYDDIRWDPLEQNLTIIDPGVWTYEFYAGDTQYASTYQAFAGENVFDFPAAARMLYGEIMIPVYAAAEESHYNSLWTYNWNEEAKTLVMTITERYVNLP